MKTTLTESGLTATIKHQGAELISLQSTIAGREYMWEGDPRYWGKHSPILFPIVGILKNNNYIYNDKKYELPRHGFARDFEFELVQKTHNTAVFSLKVNEETLKIYPFHFELQVIYTLKAKQLEISYKVINNEKVTLPFSIGAHPAFALPEAFEDYTLQFEKPENLLSHQLENDLLSDTTISIPIQGDILPLTYSLFEKDALIFKQLQSKKIILLENTVPLLAFRFDDFPNFGIWTKMGAPFVCLEPWFGYSDTLRSNGNLIEKEAIQFLDANAIFTCHFSIEIL